MNKRILKKQAKNAEKIILERSSNFFDELIKNNYEKKETNKKSYSSRIIAITSTTFAAVLTLVLCLVFLLPDNSIVPPEKHYLIENEKIDPIDISELKIEYVDFNLFDNYKYTTYIAYDIEFDDTLYYYIKITDEDNFESIIIYFYVNADYENRKALDYESGTKTINDLSFVYCKNAIEDDGIFTITYSSITELDNLMIYIEYEQWTFDDEGNFFNFFEQTIKKAE